MLVAFSSLIVRLAWALGLFLSLSMKVCDLGGVSGDLIWVTGEQTHDQIIDLKGCEQKLFKFKSILIL